MTTPGRKPLGVRCFALALRLLPPDARAQHGDSLLEVFEELHREAKARRGWRGAFAATAAELPGLVKLAIVCHRNRRESVVDFADLLTNQRKESMLDSFIQDLRFALRSLARAPGFTAVAIATLALGIGANTAIFSVVNGVLLQPLSFARPAELVVLGEGQRNGPLTDLNFTTPGSFYDWQRQSKGFTAMAAVSFGQATLTGQGEPETVNGISVVGDLFGVLGVRAALGRTPTVADEADDAPAIVVLSDNAWRRWFGANPGIVGSTITINGTPRTVVGVMPRNVSYPGGAIDMWTPARFRPAFKANRDQYMLSVIARLAPGVSLTRARGEMEAVSARMRRDWAQYSSNLRINVVPLRETIVSDVRERLAILMGAVVLVLLVACANLGNLLLARSVARRREMAVRQALGARGTRIVRQLLTESLVLALLGGAAGAGVGAGFLRMILAQRSVDLPRIEEISLDGTALLFTLAIAIASGIAFGLVPALQLSRGKSADAMREGARGSAGHGWIRNLLVVSEFALATMLLCGAGLLLHSFARLTRVDPGLESEHLLTFSIRAPRGDSTFAERSLERIRAIPGVAAASATTSLPLSGRGNGAWITIVKKPLPPNAAHPATLYRVVTPEFFTTAGIPLRRGRTFTGAERADHGPAVVINEALAKRFWPGEDPIGAEIWLGAPENALTPHSPIVGIVGDTRDVGLGAEPVPTVYVPYTMVPGWQLSGYVVRTAGEPAAFAAAVRREIRALDPSLPIRRLGPMDDLVRDSAAPARWSLTLLATFAGVALTLAAIGIFGVLSFVVTQRMRELGIRIALGASPEQLRRMVVTQSLGLVLVGSAVGLAGALAMSRFMEQLLFGITPMDPPTYIAATAVLISVALLAGYAPARRATRADPIVALRSE